MEPTFAKIELPVEEFKFSELKLAEIESALQKNLKDYFENVEVKIIDCPDLSESPFNLATKGFGGGVTGIIDIGGPPYLIPIADKSKVYEMSLIAPKYIGEEGFPQGWYISGAGAGPWPSQCQNSEMIISMMIDRKGEVLNNRSKVALLRKNSNEDSKIIELKNIDTNESRLCLLGNLMVSSGIAGKILKITCSKGKSSSINFTKSIRESLLKEYKNNSIGLGGIFLIENAKTKIHVMQDFSKIPLLTDQDVNNWLKFFEVEPPMLFQSVLVTSDPGLDLRVEHSHGWSTSGKSEGGHYHYDLSSETVEYTGYYAVASKLWRIDRPLKTHLIGRD